MAWRALDGLAGVLLDATLAAAVLLTVVALAMVGTRQPVRRCGLARGALAGSIALLPLVMLRPAGRFDVVERLTTLAPPVERRSAESALGAPGRLLAGWAEHGPQLSARTRTWGPRLLTLAYLAGVAWRAGALALGCWGAGWIARRSAAPSSATLALYESLPFAGGRRPRLRVAGRAGRPVLLGVVRPLIVIPPVLDQPEARERLRLSLLHELVHAGRRDLWFGQVAALAEVVWYFLPPLWWIMAQMRLDQEFLADHDASAGFGPFGTYAASLVDLADAGPATAVGVAPGEPTPREPSRGGSALFLRVLMLVRCPFPVELRAPIWWRSLVPPALAAATLLASCLTLQGRAGSGPPPAPNRARPGLFQLSLLTIDAPPVGPDGHSRPYPLPMRLPPRFQLAVDVWGDADTLPSFRLLGLPLGLPPRASDDPPAPEGWHTVRVERDDHGVTLSIDDQPWRRWDNPVTLPESITIQAAPRQSLMIRNLKLTW